MATVSYLIVSPKVVLSLFGLLGERRKRREQARAGPGEAPERRSVDAVVPA